MKKKVSLFCDLLEQALSEKWGYVWGLDGEKYSENMAGKYKKANRSPPPGNSSSTYWTVRCKKWYNKNCADCSGLIVWAMRKMGILKPNEDLGSAALRARFVKKGTVSSGKMPEQRGIGLYRAGHIAVYMGSGVILEAKGTDYGVVSGISKLSDFKEWGYFNGMDYGEEDVGVYVFAECNGEGVNVRSGPGTKHKSLGKISKGTAIKVKKTSGDWLKTQVSLNGKQVAGYIYSKYVSFK